jgi:peptidyl-prolyl cis-trans isomerase SurA
MLTRVFRFAYWRRSRLRQLAFWPDADSVAFDLSNFRRWASSIYRYLLLVGLMLTAGCHGGPPASGNVWARVGGQPILRQEVEKIYKERMAAGNDAADPEEALNFKLNILNQLINDQILVGYALHSGITVSEAEVDTRIAQIRSPYSSQEFEQKLKQQGMDLADLRQEVRTSLIINKLINRDIDSHLSVGGAEISAYYNRNKANFSVPETEYHLAQIEVTPYPDPEVRNLKDDDAKNPVDARRKAQALYAQLRAGGSFKALAENYSEDARTAPSGGDMGFVPISALNANPQLKKVVSTLKVGQISGIVQTRSGYHIIKLLGIERAGQRTLSDPAVEAAIRKTLMNEKEQLLRAAYIEVLRDRAKVRNYLAERIMAQEGAPLK